MLVLAGCVVPPEPPTKPVPVVQRTAPADWFQQQLAAVRAARAAHTPKSDTAGAQAEYDRILHASLLIMAGDREGYRRICGEAFDLDVRDEDADAVVRAVRPGILAPEAPLDLDRSIRLVEHAMKGPFPNPINGPGCALYVLGAAHYRAGHYEQAVRYCRRSLEEYAGWGGKALNWPVLALAHHRLGRAEEARKALSQAWSLAGRTRRGRFDVDLLLEGDTRRMENGLELMVWVHEAEAVILDDPVFPGDPFAR